MSIKNNKQLIIIGAFSIVTFISYIWFSKTSYFEMFALWSQRNKILFIGILLLIKFVGVIWPPIPGGLFTLGAIPIIGWQWAYVIDLIGSETGSLIAYFIGKKYGFSLLNTLFDKTTVKRIRKFKVKKNREIEAVIILRIFLGTTIVEIVSYASGLLGIRLSRFLIGGIISHALIGIPIFYFADNLLAGRNFIVNIAILVIALPLLWRFRTRYFKNT